MAGWDDLVAYVRVRYEVMRQADDELWFNLPTTGDRTQLVVVRRVTGADDEPWAQIASPICKVGDAQLDELLGLAAESVVGLPAASRRRRVRPANRRPAPWPPPARSARRGAPARRRAPSRKRGAPPR